MNEMISARIYPDLNGPGSLVATPDRIFFESENPYVIRGAKHILVDLKRHGGFLVKLLNNNGVVPSHMILQQTTDQNKASFFLYFGFSAERDENVGRVLLGKAAGGIVIPQYPQVQINSAYEGFSGILKTEYVGDGVTKVVLYYYQFGVPYVQEVTFPSIGPVWVWKMTRKAIKQQATQPEKLYATLTDRLGYATWIRPLTFDEEDKISDINTDPGRYS